MNESEDFQRQQIHRTLAPHHVIKSTHYDTTTCNTLNYNDLSLFLIILLFWVRIDANTDAVTEPTPTRRGGADSGTPRHRYPRGAGPQLSLMCRGVANSKRLGLHCPDQAMANPETLACHQPQDAVPPPPTCRHAPCPVQQRHRGRQQR